MFNFDTLALMEEEQRLVDLPKNKLPDVLKDFVSFCESQLHAPPSGISFDTKTQIYFINFLSFTLNLKVDDSAKVVDIKNVKSQGGKDKATDALLNLVYIAKNLGFQKMFASDVQDGAMEYWVTVLNFEKVDETTAVRDLPNAEPFDW